VYYSDANIHKIPPYDENPNVKKLENIIKINKDKGVKMIIFHPPFHKYYLDLISNESKENFKIIMNKISDKYDIRIYDLHEKYVDLNIWSDLVHVAYNPDSMIFTDDISKIILEEIKE
jgi:poly-D-alanine transfer protein DltD